MLRSLTALLLFAAVVAGSATAFEAPDAGQVVRKVRKSVIRISGLPLSSPIPFQTGAGGGSGVVFQIDYDRGVAYALTNHHVSGDAMINSVRFWDESEYMAHLVATEPGIDTALLEIQGIPDERNLPDSDKTIIPATLGDSDAVQIGEFAVAMGSPGADEGVGTDRQNVYEDLMLRQTATMRVVTGRESDPFDCIISWAEGWAYDLGHQVVTNLPSRLLTQSAINPGNSGGPLFNMRGEVIGLNHAHFGAASMITQNQNYTIPINYSKNFAYQILNTGTYELPWMGLDIFFPKHFKNGQEISEFYERHLDKEHAKVLSVRKDSPAERAGFMTNDVIVEFDGQTFPSVNDLREYVFRLPIGKQIPVTVLRNRKKVDLVVETGVKRRYDSEFSL